MRKIELAIFKAIILSGLVALAGAFLICVILGLPLHIGAVIIFFAPILTAFVVLYKIVNKLKKLKERKGKL